MEFETSGVYRYGDGTYWSDFSLSNVHTPMINSPLSPLIFGFWRNNLLDDISPTSDKFTYFSICQGNPTNVIQK